MARKMTFQPKKLSRQRVHGFRARMATKGGRKVLAARRLFPHEMTQDHSYCAVVFSSITDKNE